LYQTLFTAGAIQLSRIALHGLLRSHVLWKLCAMPRVQRARKSRVQHVQRYLLSFYVKENIDRKMFTRNALMNKSHHTYIYRMER
jgi:hypothetical protein